MGLVGRFCVCQLDLAVTWLVATAFSPTPPCEKKNAIGMPHGYIAESGNSAHELSHLQSAQNMKNHMGHPPPLLCIMDIFTHRIY